MSNENKKIETEFEYNGAKYEFDMRDADDAAKYEKAIEALKNAEKEMPKDGNASVLLKAHCIMIRDYFDACLGDGAGVKVCGEKFNVAVHYDAYEKFVTMVRRQKNDVLRAINTFGQYSNRKQRRSAKRNGN